MLRRQATATRQAAVFDRRKLRCGSDISWSSLRQLTAHKKLLGRNDGFVEYARLNDRGLINQGWRDSWDGINFADGTLAEPPIALCEVQAYFYGTYMSRA